MIKSSEVLTDTNNLYSIKPCKPVHLLSRKRVNQMLDKNSTPEYEYYSWLYQQANTFDWDNEKIVKLKDYPSKCLNLFCSASHDFVVNLV